MYRNCPSFVSKPALTLVALAIVEIAAITAFPTHSFAAPASAPVEFQQEPLPLAEAIQRIASRAGVSVAFDAGLAQGRTAAAVRGALTLEQALLAALRDTDLELRQAADGSYTVDRKRKPQVTAVLPMTVIMAKRLEKGYAADSSGGATRTDTPLLELAQSVSTVSRELMRDQQATSVFDALRNVSSMGQDGIANGPQPSVQIRGFAVDASASDGMMSNGAMELYTPTIGLEKVEVIKGPESIVSGTAAAFGGLINLVAKKPQADRARELQYGIDSNGLVQLGLDVTGALNESKELSGRLILSAQKNPDTDLGWKGGKNNYLAPSLAWRDAKNTLIVGAEYQKYHRPLGNFAYSLGLNIGTESPAVYHNEDDGIDYDFRRYHLDYQHDFGDDLKVGVRARFQDSDSEGKYWLQNPSAIPITAGDFLTMLAYDQALSFTTKAVQIDVKKKLTWGSTEHRLLAGFDFSKNRNVQKAGFRHDGGLENLALPVIAGGTGILPPVRGLANYFPIIPETKSGHMESGFFLQDQIAIGDDWNLLLAARHVSYRPQLGSKAPSVSKGLPSIGVVYRPLPNVAVYGNYSEGLDATISLTTRAGEPLPPTRAKQFELGLKQSYMGERLILTTALFNIKKKDVAIPDIDNSGFYHVSPGQESKGLEVELTGRISPALNVSLAYTHAISADDVGMPLLGLAKNQFNLWTQYRFIGGDWAGWNISGGVVARSGMDYVIPFFNVKQRNPGNARLDAVIGYEAKDWSARFGIRNITDRVLFSSGSTVGMAEVEARRTFTLTGSYRF